MRQEHKTRHKQKHAPERREHGGCHGTLYTLVISDESDVDREKDSAQSEQRQPSQGYPVGRLGRGEEQGGYGWSAYPQAQRHDRAANSGREEGYTEGAGHTGITAHFVIKTYYRLGRLGDSVAYREYYWEEIARHGESGHALFVEHRHEHIIACEHHHAHGKLGQESGKSYLHDISDIAYGEKQGRDGEFQSVEPQLIREPDEIRQGHQSSENTRCRRSHGRSLDTHVQREYHVPIERNVHYGDQNLYPHGITRKTQDRSSREKY